MRRIAGYFLLLLSMFDVHIGVACLGGGTLPPVSGRQVRRLSILSPQQFGLPHSDSCSSLAVLNSPLSPPLSPYSPQGGRRPPVTFFGPEDDSGVVAPSFMEIDVVDSSQPGSPDYRSVGSEYSPAFISPDDIRFLESSSGACASFSVSAAAGPFRQGPYNFRRAGPWDFEKIVQIYEKMSPDDLSKLLVYPGKAQRMKIWGELLGGKLFVALEQTNGAVVAMLKLYIMPDEMLEDTLSFELRMLPWGDGVVRQPQPYVWRSFSAVPNELSSHRDRLRPIEERGNVGCGLFSRWEEERSALVAIYYGGAYTIPSARDQGVGAALDVFAMQSIADDVKHAILAKGASRIGLFYGQVNANFSNQRMLRSFLIFLGEHEEEWHTVLPRAHGAAAISVNLFVYRAHLPRFFIDGDVLRQEIVPPASWQDFGCLLLYDIV